MSLVTSPVNFGKITCAFSGFIKSWNRPLRILADCLVAAPPLGRSSRQACAPLPAAGCEAGRCGAAAWNIRRYHQLAFAAVSRVSRTVSRDPSLTNTGLGLGGLGLELWPPSLTKNTRASMLLAQS